MVGQFRSQALEGPFGARTLQVVRLNVDEPLECTSSAEGRYVGDGGEVGSNVGCG